MENTLEQEWNSYFTQMNEIEKKSVLLLLKTFLKERSVKKNSFDIEEYNKEIDEALAEVESGNYITQDEMENLSSKR